MSEYPENLLPIAKLLDEHHAEDLRVLDVRDVSSVADVMIVATGTSTPHLRALAEEVHTRLKKTGIKPLRMNGDAGSGWVVLDYADVVVHVMTPELREFYALEQLWSDAKTIDLASLIDA